MSFQEVLSWDLKNMSHKSINIMTNPLKTLPFKAACPLLIKELLQRRVLHGASGHLYVPRRTLDPNFIFLCAIFCSVSEGNLLSRGRNSGSRPCDEIQKLWTTMAPKMAMSKIVTGKRCNPVVSNRAEIKILTVKLCSIGSKLLLKRHFRCCMLI